MTYLRIVLKNRLISITDIRLIINRLALLTALVSNSQGWRSKEGGANSRSDLTTNRYTSPVANMLRELPSLTMIGMAGQNSERAIELFGQQNPRDLVRKGHSSERQGKGTVPPDIRVKPVRPAEKKGKGRRAIITPLADLFGKSGAGHGFPCFIQGYQRAPARRSQRRHFLDLPLKHILPPTFCRLRYMHTSQPLIAADPLQTIHIMIEQLKFRPALHAADRGDNDIHRAVCA